jgi:hypothetical protein
MTDPIDLKVELPRLLPPAIAWAEAHEREVLAQGSPLNPEGIRLARIVGVQSPERIRVSLVAQVPLPEDPELRAVAIHTGLLGPQTGGLTLGYGIYIVHLHLTGRLLSHECRHVHQYEHAGSIAAFLPVYLQQIAEVGYARAPLELDAQLWEQGSG